MAVGSASHAAPRAIDVGVGAEQRRRRQHRRGDRDALGDRLGGVADRVELGEDLGALLVDVAGHLRDALRVVGDRAEGVHRDDDADGGEQAAAGQRHREQRDGDSAAPPSRKAPNTAAPMTSAVYTADSKPTERPDRITVAAPVSEVLPTSLTGRCSVPV